MEFLLSLKIFKTIEDDRDLFMKFLWRLPSCGGPAYPFLNPVSPAPQEDVMMRYRCMFYNDSSILRK